MKNIFFIHFNEEELKEKIQPLKKAGYNIRYHFSTETIADFRNNLPEVLVISLDRLPSHGRQYAQWLWEAKKRQHIPIIFCDGQAEKVKVAQEKFPKAIFYSNEELVIILKKISHELE
jgi:hypothetical protein